MVIWISGIKYTVPIIIKYTVPGIGIYVYNASSRSP